MDTGLIRPYSVIQWRCQWSAFRGWPSHSMCSRPHFTGKPDWPRADFAENCLLRAGSKASAVSRFREKLSPANGVQGITAILRKIALLCVMSAKLAKWVAKNGVQHATAIYPIPRYTRPRYIGLTLYIEQCYNETTPFFLQDFFTTRRNESFSFEIDFPLARALTAVWCSIIDKPVWLACSFMCQGSDQCY